MNEKELTKFEFQIQNAERTARQAQSRLHEIQDALTAKGYTLTSPDAAAEIGTAQAQVDERVAELKRLNADRQVALEQFMATVPGGEATVSGKRGIGVGFDRQAIEAARAHLLGDNPGPIRLGPPLGAGIEAATQTSGDWGQAGVTTFDLAHVWPFLREQPRIADIFPVDAIATKSKTYFRFNTAADQAAVVAENGAKPQSSPHTDEVVATPQVVAHYGAFTRQMLLNADDFLNQYTAEFVAGLGLAVDQGLVSGNGSGQLNGIANASGICTYVRDSTNETRIDAILGGITTVRTTAFREPTHLLIHPNDLEKVRKEKAATGGLYLADPTASLYRDGLPDALWGLTAVATTSVSQGTAIVIDPVSFGTIVMRLPIVAEIDPYSLFTTNAYQLRVETMLDLVAIRPKAACLVEDL